MKEFNSTVTIEHKRIGIVLSDIINGQLIKQVYQGYTTAEAKKKFKQYTNVIK